MATESNDKPTAPASTPAPATSGAPRPAGSGYAPRPAGSGYGARPGAPSGPGGYKGRPSGGPGGRGRPPVRRRVCRICMDRTGGVDWKAVNFLRNFITERGKILSGRATGNCSRCQRQLTRAIKRARTMALLPTSPF